MVMPCCLMAPVGPCRRATHVKKGVPPSMLRSLVRPGACRKASTSLCVLNCGMRVSSLVLTSTVRDREGSTCRHNTA